MELDQKSDGLSRVIDEPNRNEKEMLVKKLSRQEMKNQVGPINFDFHNYLLVLLVHLLVAYPLIFTDLHLRWSRFSSSQISWLFSES